MTKQKQSKVKIETDADKSEAMFEFLTSLNDNLTSLNDGITDLAEALDDCGDKLAAVLAIEAQQRGTSVEGLISNLFGSLASSGKQRQREARSE